MLIVALVLAVIGLAALVTAVVTSNELIAWVCIARQRDRCRAADRRRAAGTVQGRSRRRRAPPQAEEPTTEAAEFDADYPDEAPAEADVETD